jgi:hypothetical protein
LVGLLNSETVLWGREVLHWIESVINLQHTLVPDN